MSWSIGYDNNWNRDIGYGVPAICDYPGCDKKIDRGLSYVCGGDAYGGEWGCGLFFCSEHQEYSSKGIMLCEKCNKNKGPFEPKPDIAEWIKHKLTDESWREWRLEHSDWVIENQKIFEELK